MRAWLTKPWIFALVVIAMGIAIGAVGGLVAYGIAKVTMPWLTQRQLDVIVPAFTAIGTIIAIYCLGRDIVRGWGRPR